MIVLRLLSRDAKHRHMPSASAIRDDYHMPPEDTRGDITAHYHAMLDILPMFSDIFSAAPFRRRQRHRLMRYAAPAVARRHAASMRATRLFLRRRRRF
jgi:hypothetical protein